MKKQSWFILPIVIAGILLVLNPGFTMAALNDSETSNSNNATAWTSTLWTQTSQSDFEVGVSTNISTASSSGNVRLTPTASTLSVTNSPTANTGSAWTNPDNAYGDAGGAATITSGAPSGNNVWGNYGFSSSADAIAQVRVRYDAWNATPVVSNNPTATTNGTFPWTNPTYGYTSNNQYATALYIYPTYRGVGTQALGTTLPVTPTLPGSMSANDICFLVASTIAGGSISVTADGSISPWTALPGSPIDVTGGEKLYVWWGRYSSGSTGPSVQASTDHINSVVVAYYNCYAGGSPIDVSITGSNTTSSTTFNFPTTLTSTYNYELAICICTTGRDATAAQFTTMANTSLTSLAERYDDTTSNGGGGGFAIAEGLRAVAGTLGTFTSTLTNASTQSYIVFALKPVNTSYIWDQIYGTFGFSGTQTITKVEIGYEAFATATQKLDIYESTNGGSSWSAVHTTANLTTSDPDAYTYIDVTADFTWTWTLLNDSNFKVKVATSWVNGTPTWSLDALIVRVTSGEYDDQIKVDVSWDGGGSWSATQNTTLTSAEVTYWYDVTGVTTWTPAKLANGKLQVRALAQTVNSAEVVNLDWLPVEVTYYKYAASGTIASQVLDTTVTGSRWDGLFWDNALPASTNITFEVRAQDASFVKDAGSPSWTPVSNASQVLSGLTNSPTVNTGSAWTDPTNAYGDGSGAATITSGAPSGNNVWGNYGFSSISEPITQVRVGYDAWSNYTMPVWQAAGTFTSGAGAITPAMPAGVVANDILLLFVESANQAISLSTPNGFVEVTNSPQGAGSPPASTNGTRLAVFWKRAVGGDTSPVVADPGNHAVGIIHRFSGCITSGDPWEVTAGGVDDVTDTSLNATGVTTTIPNSLIVIAATTMTDVADQARWSAWMNADLSDLTERSDDSAIAGNGGGIGVATGGLATAGASGETTATAATATTKAWMTIALKPDNLDQIRVDVSWDGGTSWSSKQTTSLTASETTYWYDVTGATSWTPDKLANGQLQVRVDAYTIGGVADTVNLDWLPVEVTYYKYASLSVTNGTGRYKQWRATLTPDGIQTSTPILQEVRVYYYGN